MRRIGWLFLAAASLWPPPADAPWPGFRGPAMSGIAPATSKIPDKWSTTENVAWAIDVPGRGWSSPIVVGDSVILTSAIGTKPFKQPSPGLYGNDYIAELRAQGLPNDEINRRVRARDNQIPEESDEIRYVVYAFSATTGKLQWEREAHKGLPSGGRHRKNTYASETPFSDGERIYVSFGQNIGMFCFDLAGNLVWKREWPAQPIYLDFGTASSPIVADGKLYLLQDSERESYLTALDAKTGKDLWRTARERVRTFPVNSSWNTPFVWKTPARTEIVTSGHAMIASYDAADGKELWRITGASMPTASALAANGLLYVGTGAQAGDGNRPFWAVKPGATGDITPAAGATSSPHVVWSHPRAAGYTPSAIVHGNRAFIVHDTGTMLVLAADTGKEIYRARVGGLGHTFSASPVAAGNRIYFPDEEGVTIVIEAGDEYKEIAQNDLDEMTLASPAISGNAMFLRTEKKLYKIR